MNQKLNPQTQTMECFLKDSNQMEIPLYKRYANEAERLLSVLDQYPSNDCADLIQEIKQHLELNLPFARTDVIHYRGITMISGKQETLTQYLTDEGFNVSDTGGFYSIWLYRSA